MNRLLLLSKTRTRVDITLEIALIKKMLSGKKKILVVTSCSKTKLKAANVKARDLYQGQFFKSVVNFSKKIKSDIAIISAKYGLIGGDQLVSYYDLYLNDLDSKQKKELKARVERALRLMMPKYDNFIVIMGKNYQSLIASLIDHRFVVFKESRGSGGWKQIASILNNSI